MYCFYMNSFFSVGDNNNLNISSLVHYRHYLNFSKQRYIYPLNFIIRSILAFFLSWWTFGHILAQANVSKWIFEGVFVMTCCSCSPPPEVCPVSAVSLISSAVGGLLGGLLASFSLSFVSPFGSSSFILLWNFDV